MILCKGCSEVVVLCYQHCFSHKCKPQRLYRLPQSELTPSKLDLVHHWATSVFCFGWAGNGKGSYFCSTRKWDSDIGPRRETCVSWGHPKGCQRGEVSRVETVNTLGKRKKVLSTGWRMWKEQRKKESWVWSGGGRK